MRVFFFSLFFSFFYIAIVVFTGRGAPPTEFWRKHTNYIIIHCRCMLQMFAFMKMLSDVNELYLQIFSFYFSHDVGALILSLSLYLSICVCHTFSLTLYFAFTFSRLQPFHNISFWFISLFRQMRTIWQLKIQRKKLLY